MLNAKRDIPIDAWIVSLDETQYYSIAEEDKPFIEKIIQIYLFDRNERTYCCELTPSYYLDPVYADVYVKEGTPDDIRDALYEKYCFEPSEGSYYHCGAIEGIPADRKYQFGEVETMDEAREDAQANWRL
jgi:hypothetical protein